MARFVECYDLGNFLAAAVKLEPGDDPAAFGMLATDEGKKASEENWETIRRQGVPVPVVDGVILWPASPPDMPGGAV